MNLERNNLQRKAASSALRRYQSSLRAAFIGIAFETFVENIFFSVCGRKQVTK